MRLYQTERAKNRLSTPQKRKTTLNHPHIPTAAAAARDFYLDILLLNRFRKRRT